MACRVEATRLRDSSLPFLEMSPARDEKAALEARAQGAQTRCDTLTEKVKVSREARLEAVQACEQREAELREARGEIQELQGKLSRALERLLAMHGSGA